MSTNETAQLLLTIGSRLLSERERLDLSQQQMADLGGVSRQSYRLYEEGRREPSLSYLLRLSEHGPDFVYLVFGDSARKSKSLPLCLSEETLGLLFDSATEIVATEYDGDLSSKKKRALFSAMCKLAATSDTSAINKDALAHEAKVAQS